MASYEAHDAYEAGRRRSSAAAAYAPKPGYQPSQPQSEYDRPQYQPGEPIMPDSAPYVPPTPPATGSQAQQPRMRRPSSSYQQPPTAPMAIPRHPGLQQAASYGQPTASYGASPSASQQPYGTTPYGTPPMGSYGQQIPPQNMYPPSSYSPNGGQRMSNSRPETSHGASPRRQGHSDRYEDAVTFDEGLNDPRPSQHSRTYSRSSQAPSDRRLSAQDAYVDEYGRRLSSQEAYNDSRGRRSSRHSVYDSSDDDDDDYDRSRRQRRSSKVSTHSKSSRGSGHRKSSSKPETRTYGDSVEWAFKGVKKLLSSKREV